MSFIRVKTLKQGKYAYEVFPYREKGKVKQKQRYWGVVKDIKIKRSELGKIFTYVWNIDTQILEKPKVHGFSSKMARKVDWLKFKQARDLSKKLRSQIVNVIQKADESEGEIKTVSSVEFYKMLAIMREINFVSKFVGSYFVELEERIEQLLIK